MKKQTKQEFTFFIDRKVTMWIRETHNIEANSEDEAKQMLIEKTDDGDNDNTFVEQEFLYDTITDMDKQDNLNNSVVEIYTDNMELIHEC